MDGSLPDLATERWLVANARNGDGRAYAKLVAPHLDVCFRVACRVARNRTLAEDAVQEALVIVHRDLHRYQPGTSLKALLCATTLRVAMTLVRSEVRRGRREDASDTPVGFASPELAAASRELGDRIQRALDTLPERRREAALLHFDGGLSHADIATALDTTEGAARQLVYEAAKALRAALADLRGAVTNG
jgi:RNA polymerase sigma-70 factor (ECF subfamily)